METLKLQNPININGKEVSELTYDIDAIDGDMFDEAANRKTGVQMKSGQAPALNAEMDPLAHKYFGFAAIIAVNPDIDWTDLQRIKGKDNANIMRIGRFFLMPSVESTAENSVEDTETTLELSTATEKPSKK